MININSLEQYTEHAIAKAENRVDAVIARVKSSVASQIRFSQNDIDISKRWNNLTLELFIVMNGIKTGFSESPISILEDIDKIVDSTIEFTKHLPDSMLFAGLEDSVKKYPKVAMNFDKGFDKFTENAPGIISSSIDSAISEGAVRVAGALKFSKTTSHLSSSLGPEGGRSETNFDLNIRAFQKELDYSGQGLACGTIPSNSEKEMVEAGSKAGRLSKMALGASSAVPGTYDLIMNPTVAANVLGSIAESANPFYIMIGFSPLQDKIGEQIAPEEITVYDDALYPGGLASHDFDFEGTPAKTTTIIDKGVMKNLIHNTSTAKMYETESTGNSDILSLGQGMKMLLPGSSNIVFENGSHTLDEMKDTNRPTIYVTSNWYTRAQNYQTGEFSTIPRDAMFLVEKGEMKPIKNLRLSDNILRMFSSISAVGNDRRQIFWWEVYIPTIIPSIKVSDCRMTTATQ